MERLIVWQRWLPPAESSPEAIAQAALWRIAGRDRFVRDGAEVVVELGGTVVFALDSRQVARSVENCLALVAEFEPDAQESGSVSFALTMGVVERPAQGPLVGDALDRAQALASVAEPFEIILDAAVQAAASTVFLFGRRVEGLKGIRGEAIDRHYPRRADCTRALLHLARPRLSSNAQNQLGAFRHVAAMPGRHRVLLMGPYGAGASSWLRQVAEEMDPCTWLDVRAQSSALAPLSGLMYALRRLPEGKTLERVLTSNEEPDRLSLASLRAVREGRPVSRRDTIIALRQYLGRAHEQRGRRVLITVNPAPLIDPATVGVMAEVTRDGGPDGLVVLRLPLDAKAPEAFARGGTLAEIRVPGLAQAEARAFALSMLGKNTSNDIARRAAAMGGNTPLGVAEAVRVLVASGDVVFSEQQFRWRRGPAGRLSTHTVEALVEERIDKLPRGVRRMLEALALVPDPGEAPVVSEVADSEGLRDSVREDAIEELVSLSLLERGPSGLSLSTIVRAVVVAGIPPNRMLELNRAIARALERRIPSADAFARATLAYHMARGGRAPEAVDIMLEVAGLAGQLGYLRSGVRLAAAAVEFDPTDATRARAARLAESFSERAGAMRKPRVERAPGDAAPKSEQVQLPEPPRDSATLSAQALHQAVEAILGRDFDAVERALELVIAAGRDGPSVDRLRAMTALVKGDRTGALRLLDRARHREENETPRTAIATALVLIETGELGAAVRQALHALALAREATDRAGERAAVATMAACYRKLGRDEDALALEGGSRRGSLPDPPVVR
ncbi:MAG: hypothetical protein QM778_02235 [Myxococcales bacterium]